MIAIYKSCPQLIASKISFSSMSTTLLVERFIIPVHETNNRPSVFVAVKKYTPRLPQSPHIVHHSARNGLSLVLTHGVTFRAHDSLVFFLSSFPTPLNRCSQTKSFGSPRSHDYSTTNFNPAVPFVFAKLGLLIVRTTERARTSTID